MTALLTALGAAAAFIAATSEGAPTAAAASTTLIDAQIVEVYVFLLAAFTFSAPFSPLRCVSSVRTLVENIWLAWSGTDAAMLATPISCTP